MKGSSDESIQAKNFIPECSENMRSDDKRQIPFSLSR